MKKYFILNYLNETVPFITIFETTVTLVSCNPGVPKCNIPKHTEVNL